MEENDGGKLPLILAMIILFLSLFNTYQILQLKDMSGINQGVQIVPNRQDLKVIVDDEGFVDNYNSNINEEFFRTIYLRRSLW